MTAIPSPEEVRFSIGGLVRLGSLCRIHCKSEVLTLDLMPGTWVARADEDYAITLYRVGFSDEPTAYAGRFTLWCKGGVMVEGMVPRRQGERDWADPASWYRRACDTVGAFNGLPGVHFGFTLSGLVFGEDGEGERRVYVSWKFNYGIVKIVIRQGRG